MKPLDTKTLHGNWCTMLLPLHGDDAIDFELLAVQIHHFVAVGANGVYSNGTAGEFYTQSEAEFDRINGLLAELCQAAGIPFQIGACHMSPQLSRARVRRAREFHPSGIQIVLPDWFVPNWDEIRRFIDGMVVEAQEIPLILYNPPHAKRRLEPAEWDKLTMEFPSIIGIKVPGGGEAWYQAMRPVLRKIAVFVPGHQLATGLQAGAQGSYSNVACLSPAGAQRWYELCRRDPGSGVAMQTRVQKFWMGHIAPLITRDGLSNMAADKAAAAAGGWLPGFSPRLRWPYECAREAEVADIAREARCQLPEFFEPAMMAAHAAS